MEDCVCPFCLAMIDFQNFECSPLSLLYVSIPLTPDVSFCRFDADRSIDLISLDSVRNQVHETISMLFPLWCLGGTLSGCTNGSFSF